MNIMDKKFNITDKKIQNDELLQPAIDFTTILQAEAFRQIRNKVHRWDSTENNDEIAGYVKGICDMEAEAYEILLKGEHQNGNI